MGGFTSTAPILAGRCAENPDLRPRVERHSRQGEPAERAARHARAARLRGMRAAFSRGQVRGHRHADPHVARRAPADKTEALATFGLDAGPARRCSSWAEARARAASIRRVHRRAAAARRDGRCRSSISPARQDEAADARRLREGRRPGLRRARFITAWRRPTAPRISPSRAAARRASPSFRTSRCRAFSSRIRSPPRIIKLSTRKSLNARARRRYCRSAKPRGETLAEKLLWFLDDPARLADDVRPQREPRAEARRRAGRRRRFCRTSCSHYEWIPAKSSRKSSSAVN